MRSDKDKIINEIARHYRDILILLGEDPEREGLLKTPYRAAKALYDMTAGYEEKGEDIISQAIFTHEGTEIVIVKDIEFYSLCEHHILPFFGNVSIGYIPDGKILGLSKLARLVNTFSKRLQVQERMTFQICDFLSKHIPNKGVIVTVEAGHLCMKMRGVEKQGATTVTTEYSGLFKNPDLRKEFFALCGTNK